MALDTLRRGESPAAALHRVARAQAARATATLRDESRPLPERVHDARKRFKETRALFRLFRAALGELRPALNAIYRDAGRELQPYRDATTIIEAVDGIARGVRREAGAAAMEILGRLAHQHHEALYANTRDLRERIDSVTGRIAHAQSLIDRSPIIDAPYFAIVEEGLLDTIAEGRRAMREAYASRDDAAFHEWRKRAKDHWHHVQFLLPVRPAILEGREADLDELAHILGDHHDLVMVGQLVRRAAPLVGGAGEAKRIAGILAARRRKLARKARPLGKRLYAPAPREIVGDVAALWNVWQSAA